MQCVRERLFSKFFFWKTTYKKQALFLLGFSVNQRQFSIDQFFFVLPNTEKCEKLSLQKVFQRNKQSVTVKVFDPKPKGKSIHPTTMELSNFDAVIGNKFGCRQTDRLEKILRTTYMAHVKWVVTDKKNLQKLV